MKMTAIVCVALALCLSLAGVPDTARAQGGVIALSSSDVSWDCDFTETVNTLNSVWVIHTLAANASGAEFRVRDAWTPLGTAMRLGVTYSAGIQEIGDIYEGVAMMYGGCEALPHVLARLDFFVFSPTPECTRGLSVEADPLGLYFSVVALDCTLPTPQVIPASGGELYINVNPDCGCFVGTEETTWSRLKGLYQ